MPPAADSATAAKAGGTKLAVSHCYVANRYVQWCFTILLPIEKGLNKVVHKRMALWQWIFMTLFYVKMSSSSVEFLELALLVSLAAADWHTVKARVYLKQNVVFVDNNDYFFTLVFTY